MLYLEILIGVFLSVMIINDIVVHRRHIINNRKEEEKIKQRLATAETIYLRKEGIYFGKDYYYYEPYFLLFPDGKIEDCDQKETLNPFEQEIIHNTIRKEFINAFGKEIYILDRPAHIPYDTKKNEYIQLEQDGENPLTHIVRSTSTGLDNQD